ncbi:hypothetical protein AGMMS50230_02160 [Spirochaetia bacterium]|nr:hypothetical protein AGMMS50230_02160 [Spirochaetia bacterium]
MNTNLLSIVKQIIATSGEGILADPQRLKAFFSDLAKDEPKPLRIAFGRCVENGAYNALKTAPDAVERASRKAAIAQRLRDDLGLDPAISGEALDILEAAIAENASTASPSALPICKNCGKELKPEWTACPYCGATTVAAGQPETAAPESLSQVVHDEPAVTFTPTAQPTTSATASAKKKATIRNALIAVVAALAIGLGIFFLVVYRPIKLDENSNIIFTQKRNNDELIRGNLALTLKDVQATQKFITKNFPDFDFEKEGYVTDDYRNELLIKEFNKNPEVMSIYLSGIKEMAGLSSTYAHLLILDLNDDGNDELVLYYFSTDQEFSDTSGFEYFNGRYHLTSKFDNKMTSIIVYRYLYINTNEPYWIIGWADSVPVKDRLALLKDFLNALSYTKVFKNLGADFFKDIYTDIEQDQTIKDIVDWWK